MQKGIVYNNQIVAGIISKINDMEYVFEYDNLYFIDDNMPPISITLPKTKKVHTSSFLFPFFFNMLSEGSNRKVQCRFLKIDEEDHFTVLLKTTSLETVGAITVKEIVENE
jgi:HipA-like protein